LILVPGRRGWRSTVAERQIKKGCATVPRAHHLAVIAAGVEPALGELGGDLLR